MWDEVPTDQHTQLRGVLYSCLATKLLRVRVLFCMAGLLCTSAAMGAVVIKKLPKNRVMLDEGRETGFAKQTMVCIYDESDTKLGCGRIIASKPNQSIVKLSQAIYDKVNLKFKATISGSAVDVAAKKKGAVKGKGAVPGGQPQPAPTGKYFARALFLYNSGATTTYGTQLYKATREETASTLWTADAQAEIDTGFGGEIGVPWNGFTFTLGFTLITFQPVAFKSDLISGTLNPYAQTESSGSAFSLWSDVIYWTKGILSGKSTIRAHAGLEMESSTALVKMQQMNDNTGEAAKTLAEAESSSIGFALRNGADFTYYFGPVGLVTGLIIRVPLLATGPTVTGKFADEAFSKLSGKPEDDLATSLGHGKGGFSFGARVGVEYAF